MAEGSSSKGTNKIKLLILIMVVCFILLAAAIGALAYHMGNKKGADDNIEPQKREVLVTKDNVNEIVEQMEQSSQKVAPGSYEVAMSTVWHFADGKAASTDSYVENSTANTNDVYFDIILKDSEEKIYSSPVIPVGSSMSEITLDKEMEAGSYDCVMVYSLLDGSQNVLSTVRVAFTIVIG